MYGSWVGGTVGEQQTDAMPNCNRQRQQTLERTWHEAAQVEEVECRGRLGTVEAACPSAAQQWMIAVLTTRY